VRLSALPCASGPWPHPLSRLPRRLVTLLEDAVDPQGSGRSLYFAYGADVTLTSQRSAAVLSDAALSAKPLWARADNRFFWNRQLAKPLIGAVRPRHLHLLVA
jgi:hypothetical protein